MFRQPLDIGSYKNVDSILFFFVREIHVASTGIRDFFFFLRSDSVTNDSISIFIIG